MYWHEVPNDHEEVELTFRPVEAEALSAACSERTQQRAHLGNSPLRFDESVQEIVAEQAGAPEIGIRFSSQGFRQLPELVQEFASRTREVVPQGNMMSTQERQKGLRRCDLGSAAVGLFVELEGAVTAYDTGFHQKLAAYLQSH